MLNKAIPASFACLALLSAACTDRFVFTAGPLPDAATTTRATWSASPTVFDPAHVEEQPIRAWYRVDAADLRTAIVAIEAPADTEPRVVVDALDGAGCVLARGFARAGGPYHRIAMESVERCGAGLPPQQLPPDLGAADPPDMAPEPPDLRAPEVPDLAGSPPDLAPRRVELAPSAMHRVAEPAPGVYKVSPGFNFATGRPDPAVITYPLPVANEVQWFALEIGGTAKWVAPSPTLYCDASEGQYTIRSADNRSGYCPYPYWEARVVPAAWGPGEGGAIVGNAWDCATRDDRGVCTSARWPELRGTPQGSRVSVPAGKQYEVRIFVQGAVEITGLTVAVSAR